MTLNGTQKIIHRLVQPPTLYLKHTIHVCNIHICVIIYNFLINQKRKYMILLSAACHVPFPLGLFPDTAETILLRTLLYRFS